ncbi:NAD-glutamate dehydrogenase domain-containing protein, partial [Pseudoxanthobacter sp.]|uniref:NAD-glutamate dehydrogenase domain-containing protein n=1 Tax=Pseudoxanthobacter sp. TaxID=1925742 RepID=UPI002FE3A02A
INSDAIDNSAGVNTSDVEVNLKIALATPVHDGRLDRRGRDALLAAMTDDVAHLVLTNNYRQTLALSLAERRGLADIGFQQRLMQSLEKRGLLDRAVEFLPDDATIAARVRGGEALARPELAVLLAYGKLSLYDDLLASSMPDDPYLARDLADYFPRPLREGYPDAIESHRLRREIIATIMANDVINRGGPAFAVRLADETGADVATIAAAFAAAFDSYRLGALYAEIDALDNRIDGQVQLGLYEAVAEIVRSRTVWFVRNVDFREGLDAIVARFRGGIDALSASLGTALPAAFEDMRRAIAGELVQKGVPETLALRIAALKALLLAPDAVVVAGRLQRPVVDVGSALFAVALRLRIENLAARAAAIPVSDYYDRLALDRALERIAAAVRAIAAEIATVGSGEAAVDAWLAANPAAGRIRQAVDEIAGTDMTVARLTVAAGLIGDLAQS